MKKFSIIPCLLLAIGIFGSCFPVMPAFGQNVGKVHELQRVIKDQQKQLYEQMQLMQELQSQVKTIAKDSKVTVQAPVLAEGTKTSVQAPAIKLVTSGEERVKLSISAHISRAVNVVDDDLTLGSRIELTITPNKAGSVDQNNEETGDIFEQRWTELSLDSKRFGKLSLGKGFTASYGTAPFDLSGTPLPYAFSRWRLHRKRLWQNNFSSYQSSTATQLNVLADKISQRIATHLEPRGLIGAWHCRAERKGRIELAASDSFS